jgi:hypothetical protein
MNNQKFQNCGTACCDCTVACKYNIIEDLCEQDDDMFTHFLVVNKEHDALNFLIIEPILGASERAILYKIEWFFRVYIENICKKYFSKKRERHHRNEPFKIEISSSN